MSYPVDYTGLSPENLVTSETHSVSAMTLRTYNIIIPNFAPFYTEHNFKVVYHDGQGHSEELVPNVDYAFVMKFVSASFNIGDRVYGGIMPTNKPTTGYFEFHYQTLGGMWNTNVNQIYNSLINRNINPLVSAWEDIVNPQERFPVVNHDHQMSHLHDYGTLVAKIQELGSAMANRPPANYNFVSQLVEVPGAASTIKDNDLPLEKVLCSTGAGKVGAMELSVNQLLEIVASVYDLQSRVSQLERKLYEPEPEDDDDSDPVLDPNNP